MAIKLSANYSKKLGLPNFSSHSFSAAVEVELSDINQVQEELQKLYALLQNSVDQEIQNPGYVPQGGHTNGTDGNGHTHNGNGTNGRQYQLNSSNGHQTNGNGNRPPTGERWNCTDGQKGFILKILSDNQMEKQVAQDLSMQLFNLPVPALNRMQASQLIEDLLVKAGKPVPRSRWQQSNRTAA